MSKNYTPFKMRGSPMQRNFPNDIGTGESPNQFNTKAALGGAASGAMAGAALGPWGAVAGGVIGGAMGGFKEEEVDPNEALADKIKRETNAKVSQKVDEKVNKVINQESEDGITV